MKKIIENAEKALIYEVSTVGKPGLVDAVDSGTHDDMDVYTFIDSSLSLINYFEKAAIIGRKIEKVSFDGMFQELRQAGIEAETAMLKATHGVNTHKGAIFALGIFVCAESHIRAYGGDLYQTIKDMTKGLVEHDLKVKSDNRTAGEKQFRLYHIGGARQEAESGYPVVEEAVDFLQTTVGNRHDRLIDTFMFIAGKTEDSTLIKRAGSLDVLSWFKKQVLLYFGLGGSQTLAGRTFLKDLDIIFKERNYTLGGAADMLICTIFVALEENIL